MIYKVLMLLGFMMSLSLQSAFSTEHKEKEIAEAKELMQKKLKDKKRQEN